MTCMERGGARIRGAACCMQDHADAESAPEAAGDSVLEFKAKLAKIKRQALTFKAKLADAAAARDAALEELRALKVGPARLHHC